MQSIAIAAQFTAYFIEWLVRLLDTHNGLVTAIATVFVAGFTWTLYKVSKQQAELTRESINLAREEFISTHRPKIIVSGFKWSSVEEEGVELEDRPIRISFRYINIGESRAEIIEIGTELVTLFTPASMPSNIKFERHKMETPIILESGGSANATTIDEIEQSKFIWYSSVDAHTLVCAGYVSYRDAVGKERRTGFCRKLDQKTSRWHAIEDAEYEYIW